MREIKFRAWDKSDKRFIDNKRLAVMADGSEIYYLDKTATWFDVAGFNRNLELMQFTGLKDKNGKEIYEGDVVIDRNKKDKAWIIEYRTDSEYVGFIPKEIGTNDISLFISWTNMEIVGNMYENSELLK